MYLIAKSVIMEPVKKCIETYELKIICVALTCNTDTLGRTDKNVCITKTGL